MNYLIDSGNLEEIKYANEFFPIVGVTTNPTLVARENMDFRKLFTSIREIIGPDKMLHVQTTATKAEQIVEEAVALKKLLGDNFFIKIPISEEGLKATRKLKEQGIGVTMTAIFAPQQALIAAKAGADFVAPYVKRLDNISADGGVQTVADIVNLFNIYSLDCQVLAASFTTSYELHKVALTGAHNATISAKLLKAAITHSMTENAIAGFEKDWKSVYGDKTVLDFVK